MSGFLPITKTSNRNEITEINTTFVAMKNYLRTFFLLFAFILPLTTFAQGKWSGEVNLDAGTNFRLSPLKQKTHTLGDISARIGYDTKKFSFDVSGYGSYHHVQVGQIGRDLNIDTTGTAESVLNKVDASVKQRTNARAGAGTNFSWRPDSYNTVRAYYNYSYDTNTPNTYTFSSKDINDGIVDYSISSNMENNLNRVHNAGVSYNRIYDKAGRKLSVDLGGVFGHTRNSSEWITGDGTAEKPEEELGIPEIVERLSKGVKDSLRYRIEPYSNNRVISANFLFSEPEFANAKNLTLDFGLGYRVRNLEDHSRASTFVNGEWRDSVSYRENFRFRTATLTPSVRVRYFTGIYKLDLTYSPEYYAQKLDSDEKVGNIDRGSVAHLADMTHTFNPWKGHQFVLGMNRSESRPDYLQVCWFLRDGQYSNEKYRGNQDLKNSITTRANLLYQFNYKIFTVSLNTTYTYQPRKIASTYDYETINDQECRVYTWINGGNSHEINENLSLSWSFDHFKTGLSGRYTFYRGFSHTGNLTESSDYSVNFNADYSLKTWFFAVSGGYQSAVKRSYTSMTAFPDCQVKISKTLGKHFNVFLEGRAVLDSEISIITESENKTQCREERIRYNNRIFVLGGSYRF